jgi:putative ABC transport system permease protein
MREPITATAYVPIAARDQGAALVPRANATFSVRLAGDDAQALIPVLRQEVRRARAELRVSTVRTQQSLIDQHLVRERLLAVLAFFFAGVALLLAGVGLYGVMHYTVVQRRRELGIRLALGARMSHIAKGVGAEVLGMVAVGAAIGLAAGLAMAQHVRTLLYGVTPVDAVLLLVPCVTIVIAAVLAAVPPIVRATRIDPMTMLRTD